MRSPRDWPSPWLGFGVLAMFLLLSVSRPSHGQSVPFIYDLASFFTWLPGAAAQTSQPADPPPIVQPSAVTPTPAAAPNNVAVPPPPLLRR